MKRVICLIIVFMLYAVCASADRYLDVSFSFSGLSDNRIETIDLYEQGDMITAVSTLIPEYAVIDDQSEYTLLSLFHSICSVNPGTVRESIQKADKQARDMIEEYLTDPVPGIYSGELFEKAISVRTARFQLSDFLTFSINTLEKSDGPFIALCKSAFSSLLRSLMQTESAQEMFMEIRIYDNWQYISTLLYNQGQAIMTISSDLSSANEKRILICHRESGRYYFRDILIKDDNEAMMITAALRSGSQGTYQQIMTEKPIAAAMLTVTNEKFDLEIKGNGLSEPLMATGETAAQDNGEAQLAASVFIKNHDEQAIDICISLSQMARSVNFSDKEMIHLSDQNENAGFVITAVSRATELAAEIIPALPDEYRKLMIKLLYP